MNFLPARLEEGKLRLPFGDAPIPAGVTTDKRDVIAGIRPEHFEDAAIDGGGLRFRAKLDVVESMGSELYAYFDAHAGEVHSEQLDELAADAGLEEVPGAGATRRRPPGRDQRARSRGRDRAVARHQRDQALRPGGAARSALPLRRSLD